MSSSENKPDHFLSESQIANNETLQNKEEAQNQNDPIRTLEKKNCFPVQPISQNNKTPQKQANESVDNRLNHLVSENEANKEFELQKEELILSLFDFFHKVPMLNNFQTNNYKKAINELKIFQYLDSTKRPLLESLIQDLTILAKDKLPIFRLFSEKIFKNLFLIDSNFSPEKISIEEALEKVAQFIDSVHKKVTEKFQPRIFNNLWQKHLNDVQDILTNSSLIENLCEINIPKFKSNSPDFLSIKNEIAKTEIFDLSADKDNLPQILYFLYKIQSHLFGQNTFTENKQNQVVQYFQKIIQLFEEKLDANLKNKKENQLEEIKKSLLSIVNYQKSNLSEILDKQIKIIKISNEDLTKKTKEILQLDQKIIELKKDLDNSYQSNAQLQQSLELAKLANETSIKNIKFSESSIFELIKKHDLLTEESLQFQKLNNEISETKQKLTDQLSFFKTENENLKKQIDIKEKKLINVLDYSSSLLKDQTFENEKPFSNSNIPEKFNSPKINLSQSKIRIPKLLNLSQSEKLAHENHVKELEELIKEFKINKTQFITEHRNEQTQLLNSKTTLNEDIRNAFERVRFLEAKLQEKSKFEVSLSPVSKSNALFKFAGIIILIILILALGFYRDNYN